MSDHEVSSFCGLIMRRLTCCLALATLTSSLCWAAEVGDEECARLLIPRSQAPLWITSGVWLEESLLIPDILQERIVEVDVGNEEVGFLEVASQSARGGPGVSLQQPSMIREAVDGSLFVSDASSREILHLSRDFRLLESFKVDRISGGDPKVGVALWNWVPFADGILGFTDVQRVDGGWNSGIAAFGRRGLETVYEDFDDFAMDYRNNYLRTNSYLASFGSEAYFLVMDSSTPSITKYGKEGFSSEPLRNFPEEFRHRPMLPREENVSGFRQAMHQYEELERSKIAAGLYAWQQSLYLLGKHALDARGRTRWVLIELDPDSGRELHRVELDTSAASLDVVPGDTWAFVEKGRVQGITDEDAPYMDISTVLLYPNALLSGGDPVLPSKPCRWIHLRSRP